MRTPSMLLLALCGSAHAADDLDTRDASASASASAAEGAFLPSPLTPRSDTQRALVFVEGGWDQARGVAMLDSTIETRLTGPLALRVGAALDSEGESAGARIELKVDALRQERAGVNVAVAGGYESIGFNTVPAVVARVAVGRRFASTNVVASAAYGQGLDLGERHGEVGIAGVHRLSERLFVGLDSHFRIDLERDDDEPEGETDWEWVSGPVATVALGRLALTLRAGASAIKLRDGRSGLGPVTTAGVGMVF
jgi:hypothetical protein